MANIVVQGPVSGRSYGFTITGDSPTVDEQQRIDGIIRQQEGAFAQQYQNTYGVSATPGEGSGPLNYAGELFKGVTAGAIGMGESGLLALTPYLPDSISGGYRELVRRGAYNITPQEDLGLEGNVAYNLGQGIGSFAPAMAAEYLTGGSATPYIAGMYMASGAGQQVEDAIASGATKQQQRTAGIVGLGVGALDIIPIKVFDKLGESGVNSIRQYLTKVAAEGGVEAAQEAAQQVAQNLAAKYMYDPNRDVSQGVAPSGAYGGAVGALTEAVLDLLPGRRRGSIQTQSPQSPQSPQATQAMQSASQQALSLPDYSSSISDIEAGILADRQNNALRQAANSPLYNAPSYDQLSGGNIDVVPATNTKKIDVAQQTARLQQSITNTASAAAKNPRLLDALKLIQTNKSATVSTIKNGLGVSINEASKILNQLAQVGAVSDYVAGKPRTQLVPYEAVQAQAAPAGAPAAPKPTTPVQDVKNAAQQSAPVPPAPSATPTAVVPPQTPVEQPAPTAPVEPGTVVGAAAPVLTPNPVSDGGTNVQTPQVAATQPTRTRAKNSKPSIATPERPVAPVADTVGTVAPEGNGLAETGQPAPSVGVPEGQQPASVAPTAPPSGAAYNPMSGAMPGAVSGAAAQRIPPGVPQSNPIPFRPAVAPEQGAAPAAVQPASKEAVVTDKIISGRQDALLKQRYQETTPVGVQRFTREIGINDESNFQYLPDVLSVKDKHEVLKLLRSVKPVGNTPEAAAARYFSKTVRPVDALHMIADDISAPYKQYVKEPDASPEEHEFYSGTGRYSAGRALDWVLSNMSPETVSWFKQTVNKETYRSTWQKQTYDIVHGEKDKAFQDDLAKAMQKTGADVTKLRAVGEKLANLRRANDMVSLGSNLTYGIEARLRMGDLKGAVMSVSNNPRYSQEIRKIARALYKYTPNATRVKVIDPTVDKEIYKEIFGGVTIQGDMKDVDVAAVYAPPNYDNAELADTVFMHTDHMSVRNLLHEITHAVTIYTINDPNNPYTRQLTNLYNAVKDKFPDNTYGAVSLDEFVAEVFGNEDFRRQLGKIQVQVRPTSGGTVRLSAYQRLVQIIANFLRKITGRPPLHPTTSAKDEALELVNQLIENRDGVMTDSTFNQLKDYRSTAPKLLALQVAKMPEWRDHRVSDVYTFLNGNPRSEPIKRFVLGTLPLKAFVDVAKKYIPEASALEQIVREQHGSFTKDLQRIEPLAKSRAKFLQNSPEKFEALVKLQGRATTSEVDPSRPRTTYANDPDKLAEYDRLFPEYVKLGPEGQSLYKRQLQANKFFYNRILEVLRSQVDAATDSAPARESLYKTLMEKIVANSRIDPYFSLLRDGNYWLEFSAPDTSSEPVYHAPSGTMQHPLETYQMAFKSAYERTMYARKLQAKGVNSVEYMRPSLMDKTRPPSAFVKQTLSILQDHNVNQEASEAILQLFLEFTPEHSFMKSFKDRKGTRGFIGDVTPLGMIGTTTEAANAMTDKAASMAKQLTNMKYGAQIQRLRNSVNERIGRMGDMGLSTNEGVNFATLVKEFDDRAQYAQRPYLGGMSQWIRSGSVAWTLGFNISTAVNQLMQIPAIAMPYLGGRYGYAKTMKNFGTAWRLVVNSGRAYSTETFGENGMITEDVPAQGIAKSLHDADHMFSLQNYFTPDFTALRDPSSVPKDMRETVMKLAPFVERGANNGFFGRSLTQDMLAAENNVLAKINKWSGFMFHHSERLNQEVSAAATYLLELDKAESISGKPLTREQMTEIAQKSLETNELINGATGIAAAPRLAQNSIGSVIFLFKRFGLGQLHMLARTFNTALRDADPAERAVAWKQFGGIFGSAAVLFGASGIPMIAALMQAIDWFKDPTDDNTETTIEKYLGEPFYSGLVNYVTGADVASRVSLNNLIFRDNIINQQQGVANDIMDAVGGPAWGIYQSFQRAYDLANQGQIERAVEAASPAAVRNVLKAVRYATDGARTMRGDKIIEDPSLYELVEQTIGYTPQRYSTTLTRTAREKQKDQAVNDQKKTLYRRYYLAKTQGDYAGMIDVNKDIAAFNKKHPDQAISPDTLKMSLKAYNQRTADMLNGASYSSTYLDAAKQSMSEYDNTLSLWDTFN